MRPCTYDRRGDYSKGPVVAKDSPLAYNVSDIEDPERATPRTAPDSGPSLRAFAFARTPAVCLKDH